MPNFISISMSLSQQHEQELSLWAQQLFVMKPNTYIICSVLKSSMGFKNTKTKKMVNDVIICFLTSKIECMR